MVIKVGESSAKVVIRAGVFGDESIAILEKTKANLRIGEKARATGRLGGNQFEGNVGGSAHGFAGDEAGHGDMKGIEPGANFSRCQGLANVQVFAAK